MGMVITPALRRSVMCFGDDTCYALGFGFPALLVLISISELNLHAKVFYFYLYFFCCFSITKYTNTINELICPAPKKAKQPASAVRWLLR